MARPSTPGDAPRARARQLESGFTYLGLMAAIVVMGILLTMASRVWTFSGQRDKEAQLLWAGDQYRLAIMRYFTFDHHYPLTLQDLLQDDSSPVARHYLRRLYRDPISGDADWTLLMDPTGVGIMGVASKSRLAPIKRRGFADEEVGFADRDCYCDWKFVYVPLGDPYHRYTAPGQGQYAPAPAAPVGTPTGQPPQEPGVTQPGQSPGQLPSAPGPTTLPAQPSFVPGQTTPVLPAAPVVIPPALPPRGH